MTGRPYGNVETRKAVYARSIVTRASAIHAVPGPGAWYDAYARYIVCMLGFKPVKIGRQDAIGSSLQSLESGAFDAAAGVAGHRGRIPQGFADPRAKGANRTSMQVGGIVAHGKQE